MLSLMRSGMLVHSITVFLFILVFHHGSSCHDHRHRSGCWQQTSRYMLLLLWRYWKSCCLRSQLRYMSPLVKCLANLAVPAVPGALFCTMQYETEGCYILLSHRKLSTIYLKVFGWSGGGGHRGDCQGTAEPGPAAQPRHHHPPQQGTASIFVAAALCTMFDLPSLIIFQRKNKKKFHGCDKAMNHSVRAKLTYFHTNSCSKPAEATDLVLAVPNQWTEISTIICCRVA